MFIIVNFLFLASVKKVRNSHTSSVKLILLNSNIICLPSKLSKGVDYPLRPLFSSVGEKFSDVPLKHSAHLPPPPSSQTTPVELLSRFRPKLYSKAIIIILLR